MRRRPPRSTRTDTLFPYTTLFRSPELIIDMRQLVNLLALATLGGCEPHPELTSRSEEHTSELQSLMRISYAVFCLKKKTSYNIFDTFYKFSSHSDITGFHAQYYTQNKNTMTELTNSIIITLN